MQAATSVDLDGDGDLDLWTKGRGMLVMENRAVEQSGGPAGVFDLHLDPSMLRNSQGTVQAMPGQQWFFQAWFRDVDSQGQATSNFTNATVVEFTN